MTVGVNIARAHGVMAERWGDFLQGEEGSFSASLDDAIVGG